MPDAPRAHAGSGHTYEERVPDHVSPKVWLILAREPAGVNSTLPSTMGRFEKGQMDKLYTMILVDDEDEVRGRISSRISEETGFGVVGTAGNGYDALELIEEHSPDVVLTDIKMPYIDGIELASIIRRDYPTVKMAFITGYNEFDYAREAIKLRVHSYLTKPLTEEAIRQFLTELKRELDDEYQSNYSREIIQKQYQESIPLLIEKCFTALLLSPTASLESEVGNLQGYGVNMEDGRYKIVYVSIERNPEHWNVIEFEKLKMSVRTNIRMAFNQEELCFHDFFFNESIVCVIMEKGALFARELDIVLNQIIRTIERFLSVRVNMGVSSFHRGFRELRGAYDEAMRAFEAGRLQSVGRLVYVDQLADTKRSYAMIEESEFERLSHALRYESVDRIQDLLEEIRVRVGASSEKVLDHHLVMLEITSVLIQYSAIIDADISSINGGDIMDSISRMKSIDEFVGWAGRLVESLHSYGRKNRMDNAEKLLTRATDYLNQNYADNDLTMQSVCDAQGISISYLGQLFKKHRSTTFVKYLTALRMEKAKEKLNLFGNRITEVAEECGYRDVYYFSHCFRKYVGVPPKTYRESQQ
jgi:two-component system, response regulator YesN